MTSQLPPKRRDTKDRADLIRHLRTNAGQLGVGFMGGRFPPLRPLGSSALIGDIEDDTAIAEPMWEYDDRLVVTAAGAQTFTLSHVPIEESLQICWHPDGKGPMLQVNERWTLSGQTVTIPDAGGDIETGDVFSAQYQYDPGVITVDEALAVIGSGTVIDTDPTIALPTGAEAKDYLVLAVQDGTTADGRLTLLKERTQVFGQHARIYAGELSSLNDVALSGTLQATWAVFRAPTSTTTSVTEGTDASPATLPSVSGQHAIWVGMVFQSVTTAGLDVPTDYTDVILGNQDHYAQRIAYWEDFDADSSPASSMAGTWDDFLSLVIGVQNGGA